MANEYKLSYTATQIDEKLGKIDNLVATVNGVSPDENGNVNIQVSGGNVDQVSIEPAEDDIPNVFFTTGGKGMPSTKAEGDVQVRMHYVSKTRTFERPVTAKVQGSSSADFPSYKKRNWTIKVYADDSYEDKEKMAFKEWPAMNKFVLKAGWVMPGHLRNVGAAKIWGQIMRTRADFDSLPDELRNSPNLGATDGFHVRVFVDGMYWGIYDWIVAKDQLFGQDKDNLFHSILNSESPSAPTCAFATTSPAVSGNWSEELQDKMSTDTKTSMENWIKFVAGATDEEFVANAENYFDVQSVIDAICFDRIILPVDNLSRNQIVFKYGTKWYMGKWDLDAILGLPPVAGQAWYPYDTAYQEGYVAYKTSGNLNLLYKRTEELFMGRFKTRYWELRNGPLSENNMVRTFGQLSDRLRSIEGLLAEENASTTGNGQFTEMPNVDNDTIHQIREFVIKRCTFMDDIITNMGTSCTGITIDKTKLKFDGNGNQTLTATVTPNGCTDLVCWKSNNNKVATVNGGVVTAVANGNATITARCGKYTATCSVSVSGTEPIKCSGVSLNKTELTFNGEGVQTITATVIPSDTTDAISWASSNPAVASVTSNGYECAVKSVGSGNAIITAKCGDYSATCSVSVIGSGIDYTVDALADVTWTSGYNRDLTTGVEKAENGCSVSSKFDLQHCRYLHTINAVCRLFLWDENDNYLGVFDVVGKSNSVYTKDGYKGSLVAYTTDANVLDAGTMLPQAGTATTEVSFVFDASTTFKKSGGGAYVELTVPSTTFSEYSKSSHFLKVQTGTNTKAVGNELLFETYGNTIIAIKNFPTVEEATAYFTEHPTTLVLSRESAF